MKTARLIHIENVTEYYKDGNLYYPSRNEKLLWSIFGIPNNVEILEKTFETEVDVVRGSSKKEIDNIVQENFEKGVYNFLPPMGINNTIELRW